jgi:hypothetical protein
MELLFLIQGLLTLRLSKKIDVIKINLENLALSIILGMGIGSLLTFLLEVFTIPLTFISIFGINVLFIAVLWILKRKISFQFDFRFNLWDVLPLIFIFFFAGISIWRTYYYPPYSYDSMMGIDLVAKYAVRDGSIANSQLFKELLPLSQVYTNQLFYAPFSMLMQVIYRTIGIDFGQIWLGVISLSFLIFFYETAKKLAHPLIAFFGVLFILFVPEFFAYSFILQTDYSNAIFFFIGVYFFYLYTQKKEISDIAISSLAMFFACWTRTETIFFIPFGSLMLFILQIRESRTLNFNTLKIPFLFSFIPTIAIFLWNIFFIEFYLPEGVDPGGQIDPQTNQLFSKIAGNISGMNEIVIFRDQLWNESIPIFLVFLATSLLYAILKKKIPGGLQILFWIGVLYIVFHLLLILFPAVNIEFTFRRGFFKFIPLMGLYLVLSDIGQWVSNGIKKFTT